MSKISLKHSGGNVVSLNSPTNAPGAADVAFKLPNADGSAGQYMKTDGSGNLAFATVSIPAGNIVFAEAHLRGNNGNPTVTRSTGFGSLTDNGVGDFTLALSSAQPDNDYTCVGNAGYLNNANVYAMTVFERQGSSGNEKANTTTAVNFSTVKSTNGSAVDTTGNFYIALMRG